MSIQTRTQRYAAAALARVQVIRQDAQQRLEWKTRADTFPVMVLQAGLAQAVGFMLAKSQNGADDRGYSAYLNDLLAVLRAGGATQADNPQALQTEILALDLMAYQRLTRQTLEAAAWLKRMGQAYIDK